MKVNALINFRIFIILTFLLISIHFAISEEILNPVKNNFTDESEEKGLNVNNNTHNDTYDKKPDDQEFKNLSETNNKTHVELLEENNSIESPEKILNNTNFNLSEDDINSLVDYYKNSNQTDEDFNLTEFLKSLNAKDVEEEEQDDLLNEVEKINTNNIESHKESNIKSLSEFEEKISDFEAIEILTFEIEGQQKEVSLIIRTI